MSALVSRGTKVAQRPQAPSSLAWRAIETSDDVRGLVARVVLGAVIFPHGAQHLLGWFGGFGFHGTRAWMESTLGVPRIVAGSSIVLELAALILLVVGAGGRFAAAWMAAFLAVAASTHASSGFFMNWLGNQKGEGFEYHFLAIALAVTVVLTGSGKLSVDRWLTTRAAESSR